VIKTVDVRAFHDRWRFLLSLSTSDFCHATLCWPSAIFRMSIRHKMVFYRNG